MRTDPIFRGVATALVTPMTETGAMDLDALGRIIDWQIGEGVQALVIAGTTGEGSTLTDAEHRQAIRCCVARTAGRVPVIAATGSNDTAYAVSLTSYACDVGADAMLVVTPYYNKATQKGLIKMYTQIADASTKPLILYNVPSRTGVGIEPATYAVLADHPNIAAIKEANGDISRIVETAALVGGKLDIYSGNDDQIVPILPLINALFCEVNPIPVKAAMAAMGWCGGTLRSPLYPLEGEHLGRLMALMRGHGLLA